MITPARALLPDFEYRRMDVGEVSVNYAIGGSGPPLLLLHGYPQNHLMWRHVAPGLARDHTVVLADLRGYGDSGKPEPDAAGLVYAKRSMAGDQVGLMRQLGFSQFELAGHDRGARVSHRLVLDHPGAVTRLAVLDIVPTRHVFHNVTRKLAAGYYHWFFLSTGHGIPEHMIGGDPGFWVRSLIGPLLGEGARLDEEAMADYIRCFEDPRTIAGSCADYRSAATTDLVHDDETFGAGQRIECPLLVLWGASGFVGRNYEPLKVWEQYATDARGQELPTGHFIPEEAPGLVTAALRDFFGLRPVTKPGATWSYRGERVAMEIRSQHERIVAAAPERITELIADFDRIWPTQIAPAPRTLGPGTYDAGIMVWEEFDRPGATRAFRVTRPDELRAEHWFELRPAGGATLVQHTIEGSADGRYETIWRERIEPLHHLILEALLDNLQAAAALAGGAALPVSSVSRRPAFPAR